MGLAHFGSCTIPKFLQPNIRCPPWLAPNIKLVVFGGADRDRTGGLLVANQALSQLSYSPNREFQVARVSRFEPTVQFARTPET